MRYVYRGPGPRRGMTLLELMVVLTVLGVLATLVVVYVIPAFQDNKNVVRGSDRVTTALVIAKQRALRDQAPRGIRFLVNANNVATQLQYIEQPDPLSGGTLVVSTTKQGSTQIQFNGVDFIGGALDTGASPPVDEFNVQPGDYFRVNGANYLIAGPFNSAGNPARQQLQLVKNHGLATDITLNTTPWQIIRQTRPISGEAPINLPQNVAVDIGFVQNLVTANTISASTQIPNRTVTGTGTTYFEILFSAAGAVINAQGSSPNIALIARDITVTDPPPTGFALDPNYARVLGINPRTGMVAGQVIAPGANPLAYALDGKSSGL